MVSYVPFVMVPFGKYMPPPSPMENTVENEEESLSAGMTIGHTLAVGGDFSFTPPCLFCFVYGESLMKYRGACEWAYRPYLPHLDHSFHAYRKGRAAAACETEDGDAIVFAAVVA